MKKLSLVILTVFFSSMGYAQMFMIGPRIGLSSSQVKIQDIPNYNFKNEGAELGFHVGLFTRFTIPGIGIYVQPEALFTQSGGKITVTDESNVNEVMEQLRDYKLNKLDIPVMVGLKAGKIFRLNVGPTFSMLLSKNVDTSGDPISDFEEEFNNATIGYQAGVGFDLGPLILDLKYEGNLSTMGNSITILGNSYSTDFRNNQLIFSLGIKL